MRLPSSINPFAAKFYDKCLIVGNTWPATNHETHVYSLLLSHPCYVSLVIVIYGRVPFNARARKRHSFLFDIRRKTRMKRVQERWRMLIRPRPCVKLRYC